MCLANIHTLPPLLDIACLDLPIVFYLCLSLSLSLSLSVSLSLSHSLAREPAPSPLPDPSRAHSSPFCRIRIPHSGDCRPLITTPPTSYRPAAMIEAAARLAEETRPRAAVSLKIDYTRQATRFGCKRVQTSSGALWTSKVAGVFTRGRPRCEVLPNAFTWDLVSPQHCKQLRSDLIAKSAHVEVSPTPPTLSPRALRRLLFLLLCFL